MKISSILLVASLGAVSAFGLPFTASNNNAVKSFRGQNAMPAKAAVMRDGLALNAESAAVAGGAVAPSSSTSKALSSRGGGMGGIDIPLMLYFLFWYVGNYYYNITNKLALKAAGGSAG
mmetsp:Transcript_6368/g.12955  ORF Transcript_6368/g.12955 Transcript_6368/m.12955 type:complete len:119 (+) Transcript_6368:119-475(+)